MALKVIKHVSCFCQLSPGVSVRGGSERIERPLSRLPNRQQPDPDRSADDCHGSDGGGVSIKESSKRKPLRRVMQEKMWGLK